MANINSVVIGENRIKYYDEVLKISNISRTWIFKYQNIEKRKFEEEKLAHENEKNRYEEYEAQKKKENIRKLLLGAAAFFVFSVLAFSTGSADRGLLCLCFTGVLALIAFAVYKKEIIYPHPAPVEKKFPDKFGLGIEMNSGYQTVFTAIGSDGAAALKKLQDDIEDADVHQGTIYFNMNDYNTCELKVCSTKKP